MSDPHEITETDTTGPPEPFGESAVVAPLLVGRYRVQRVLGAGGFGTVYLAYDSQLQRRVAIKVPRAGRRGREHFCALFLAEARVLAKLDHQHIVPVYDLGSTDDHPCYIVSKFVDGQSLAKRMSTIDWSWDRRAQLIIAMADALHCAHSAGLVHRDVKPGNILLDHAEKAYLADFGLAFNEEDYQFSWTGGLVGTLNYMSPEQVRGESHLIDGRADVFSLGAVMYELLTGARPFAGHTREKTIYNILNRDVKPLRQRDAAIPRELDRICLRALERRTSHRFARATDLADELREFVGRYDSNRAAVTAHDSLRGTRGETGDSRTPPGDSAASTGMESFNQRALTIVPKGLRAFDADDAEFFLWILPGPKDRLGVPESLRFWKRHIESRMPEESFRAGVLYGPSGCGKSSMVRAGLLPLLRPHVLSILVSATADDTEERLRRSIVAALPELDEVGRRGGLAAMLQSIRLREQIADTRIVLLVIDQFEQWLSEHGQQDNATLINALRQCDGVHLKVLFLVRNDFWMSISRVMEQLESPLIQGHNSAAVELFDLRHAERVLFAFGHAYEALPAAADELSPSQLQFLKQSVMQLAEDGAVICVRLALYAQMIRDKPWELRTLAAVGGVSGLGIRFLDQTFCGPAALPEYRHYRLQAQKILSCLLPKPGSDIRGAMRSEQQLADAIGTTPEDHDFRRLMQILYVDLRLLSTTDAWGSELAVERETGSSSDARVYYQLTHDYLVPSLRAWLNAKQRDTAAGRAQLCLQERTDLWELSRETRQLPGWLETGRILWWTSRAAWTPSQSAMMAEANRLRIKQAVGATGALVLLIVLMVFARGRYEFIARTNAASSAFEQLMIARFDNLTGVLDLVDRQHPMLDDRLRAIVQERDSPSEQRLRALLGLCREGSPWTNELLEASADVDAGTLDLVVARLRLLAEHQPRELSALLRMRFLSCKSSSDQLRYAAMIANVDPSAVEVFQEFGSALTGALVEERARERERFMEYLEPAHALMIPFLLDIFHDAKRSAVERTAAAEPLAQYAGMDTLPDLLLSATPSQHFALMSVVSKKRPELTAKICKRLEDAAVVDGGSDADRRAHEIMTLVQLKPQSEVISRSLAKLEDPSARTRFILQCHEYRVPLEQLLLARQLATEPVARQALILALSPYRPAGVSKEGSEAIIDDLQQLVTRGFSQSERGAAAWVLRQWAIPLQTTPPVPRSPADAARGYDWYVDASGLTMVILRAPMDATGTTAALGERDGASVDPDERAPITYRTFAISATEVTREQYRAFEPNFEFIMDDPEDNQWPANATWCVSAMRYCRWLDDQAGLDEDEMCYPPREEIYLRHAALSEELLNRPARRLPTEAEWEFACQAGSRTLWSHGDSQKELVHFGWHAANSNDQLRPAASLMPNAWGLFDMHGNVSEWCHPALGAVGQIALRGGNYRSTPPALVSRELNYPGSKSFSFTGFRIAQTLSISSALP